VGWKVLAGDAIGTYGKAMGISLRCHQILYNLLVAMLIGYIVSVLLPKYLSQQKHCWGLPFWASCFVWLFILHYVAIAGIALLDWLMP
jgi:hypothetical protein